MRSKVREILGVLSVHDVEKAMRYPPKHVVDVIKAKLMRYDRLLVKATLRSYWRDIEEYITSAPRLLKLIESERPDIAERIKQNPRWFNEFLKQLYKLLYELAWR